jgi:hypothetical protein
MIVNDEIRVTNGKVKCVTKLKRLKRQVDDAKRNAEPCNFLTVLTLSSFQSSFVKLDQIEISPNIFAPFSTGLL